MHKSTSTRAILYERDSLLHSLKTTMLISPFQTDLQNLAVSIIATTRARLTTKEILLCFFGSGLFILIGTLTINFFQNKQRPRK